MSLAAPSHLRVSLPVPPPRPPYPQIGYSCLNRPIGFPPDAPHRSRHAQHALAPPASRHPHRRPRAPCWRLLSQPSPSDSCKRFRLRCCIGVSRRTLTESTTIQILASIPKLYPSLDV